MRLVTGRILVEKNASTFREPPVGPVATELGRRIGCHTMGPLSSLVGEWLIEKMLTIKAVGSAFEIFVADVEPRIREALSASLGSQRGRDATADALAYAWENWERVREMDNPAGYLYVVGRDRGRKQVRSRHVTLLPVGQSRLPEVEPKLIGYLERLPERQRIVVVLLYCFEWTMSEVAEVLGLSKSTIQRHAERGLASLRIQMGVEL